MLLALKKPVIYLDRNRGGTEMPKKKGGKKKEGEKGKKK